MVDQPQTPSQLAGYFISAASERYVLNSDGTYRAHALRLIHRSSKCMGDLADDFENSALMDNVTADALRRVEGPFQQVGLSEFTFAAEGSSAICYESHEMAVRAGPTPHTTPPSRGHFGMLRHVCPLVVQPFHKIDLRREKVMFEALPFVGMLKDNQIPDNFKKLIPKILDRTCFEVNMEDKDLAVLPDGTPIYVDPGAINLKSWDRQPTPRDFEIIRENTQKLNLPEPLSWVLPDGRFKQELFFPKPANALNLVI